MSATNISATGTISANRRRSPDWRWLMARGAVATLLGVVGLALVPVLTLSSVLALGVALVGAAIYQLTRLTGPGQSANKAMRVGYAVAYGFGGTAMVLNPPAAAVGLTLMAAVALGIWGFRRLIVGGARSDRGMGVIAIVAGTAILVTWPLSGVWGIGLAVATMMLAVGWQNLVGGVSLRRRKRSDDSVSGTGSYVA